MSDFLEREEFLQQATGLVDAFPGLKSRAKLDRVWYYMKLLPKIAVQDIFNLVIDTYKSTPTPADFKKESSEWKKRNNYVRDDPYNDVRDRILAMQKRPSLCDKCGNSGIVEGYWKFKCLAPVNFYCHCEAGKIARSLPEYRFITRTMTKEDPFWFVFSFDPNKALKIDLYKGISTTTEEQANPILAELYYGAEVYLKPCYYLPEGFVADPEANPWPNHLKNKTVQINQAIDVKKVIELGSKTIKRDEEKDYL